MNIKIDLRSARVRAALSAMLADGCTTADVAREFGMSYRGAQQAIRRAGHGPRPPSTPRDVYKDAAVIALVAGGAGTSRQVARLLKLHPKTVYARMDRLRREGLLRMTGWVGTARWTVTEKWTDHREP